MHPCDSKFFFTTFEANAIIILVIECYKFGNMFKYLEFAELTTPWCTKTENHENQ